MFCDTIKSAYYLNASVAKKTAGRSEKFSVARKGLAGYFAFLRQGNVERLENDS